MSIHKSVLLKETIESLNLKNDSVVVDATFGGGGHSKEILKIIEKGKLIGIDADEKAIKESDLKNNERAVLVNDNFENLENILEDLKIEKVDAILADLGWSSDQLVGKGMSFQEDEQLDMRLSESQEVSAKEIVNEYEQRELERIIRDYGEEKFWKIITKRIIEYRKEKKIETTKELAGIVQKAIPERFRHTKMNLATKTFQALRIEVNQELANLEKFIPQAIERLNLGGRLAIISFHSLEDRIVKNIFRENARGCICPPDFPQCACGKKPKVAIITRKPIAPTDLEVSDNPKSRSAKLRVCEKS
ncbi:MAG: Ribosomal RNA small subunit methyltransferase H [Candidatus Moranbacteria bacterium GW2011_GWF2_36_839]|nr:MAG: Ribosomal RNA small subunit methyltransferase H [Candidatus Moranbacteria bacterium GW2011_GWF1_36_78]KKQ17358.1 MAG: Ribosomal RNA small subunit methyltransferase H [Candidatus Moranbacteria bacterium GW2011_GWF2_36_839]HAT73799.1 16S rRNA (cytosine(1402)-N(4))-methyltransferase [Candidatus Moranbacteria bacterium]HBY11058.1 16S rRNA (cytosine(1402)-N(4))-methyltransferase [Candidatus Moranbacteria bacterium]